MSYETLEQFADDAADIADGIVAEIRRNPVSFYRAGAALLGNAWREVLALEFALVRRANDGDDPRARLHEIAAAIAATDGIWARRVPTEGN